MKIQLIPSILIVLAAIIYACTEPEVYPIEPKIEFSKFSIKDSVDDLGNEIRLARLVMTVKDGDGDIGLDDADTMGFRHPDSLHHYNLFIKLFKKENQQFEEVELAIPHNYRTPFYETQGQNKSLKADIQIKFEYSTRQFQYDTIKYSFFIYDRELHRSNDAESPELPINKLLTN